MKKTLSLILALLMSVSCAAAIFADEPAITEDTTVEETVEETAVATATPYDKAIKFLNTYGIMKGKGDGLYAEDDVMRFEMALFAGRIATGWVEDKTWEDHDANDTTFTDLAGTYAEKVYGAMSYVNQMGIITGYPDGTFKPEQVVTYREALTMAVRTLGYKGLEYPWGYIKKAVELGLTDGITGVAYTEVINRGVAAQIIYNAMFAENSKLALANFGRAFGWADIVVTSSVVKDNARAQYTAADVKTPAGYISFQLLNADGTIDSNVYYLKTSDLGLATGHDDELALGKPYSALFELDGKDNLVKLVDFDEYAATVTTNNGRTDDKGVKYDTVDNVKAYLKGYTLVDKYTTNTLLAGVAKINPNEVIISTTGSVTVVTGVDYNKTPYAFDWETGDILVKNDKDEYTVAWHYNAEYDYYFEIVTTKKVDGTTKVVGINVMDENDLAALKKAIKEAIEVTTENAAYVSATIGDAIYATLTTYDLDADGLADRGMYEAYSYGKISQTTKADTADTDDHGDRAAFAINGTVVDYLESGDCSHIDGAWWQDAYAPITDADGKIVSAYVIYGYNSITKELKVIKTIQSIEETTDADTYYATGILRGFSISKGYVVIGEEKIEFNADFGSFDIDSTRVWTGSAYVDYKTGDAYKAYLYDKLDALFNEFVRYYVVDGKLVEMSVVDAGHGGYIVVDSYAGISSDGYIVVNGYCTDNLKYEQFRIAVYDGWNLGDFFWYGNSAISDEFVTGNLYKVSSYDKTNDVYFVDVFHYGRDDRGNVIIDNVTAATHTIELASGYRIFDNASPAKVTDDDKYIIIGTGKANYMPIAVYQGKGNDGWTVTGQFLAGDKDSKTFVIVNATNVVGFNADAWNINSLVMVLDVTVLDKFYDAANLVASDKDWYLYGATVSSNVLVYNFYTGNFEYATKITNGRPVVGSIYTTVDGVLMHEYGAATWANIYAEMQYLYADDELSTADYLFAEKVEVTVDVAANNDAGKNKISKDVASGLIGLKKADGTTLKVNGLVSDVKVVKLVKNAQGVVTSIEPLDKAAFEKFVEAKNLTKVYGDAVFTNGDTLKAVIYVDEDDCDSSKTTSATTVNTKNALAVNETEDAGITGSITYTGTTVKDSTGTTTTYTVSKIGFTFAGSLVKNDNHATIESNGYFFDYMSRCNDADDWFTTANEARVYDNAIKYTPYTGCEDGAECDMIKAITITLPTAITLTAGETVTITVAADFGGDGTVTTFVVDVTATATGVTAVFTDASDFTVVTTLK